MIEPTNAHGHHHPPVRDGQVAPVTCAACGCRLETSGAGWVHFGRLGGRDARGCRVPCVDLPHFGNGHPAIALAS